MLTVLQREQIRQVSEVIKSEEIHYNSNLTEIHDNVIVFKCLQKINASLYMWHIIDSFDQGLGKKNKNYCWM